MHTSKITLATTLVDNPQWRPDLDGEKAFPRKTRALVNTKESAISRMAAQNALNAAQVLTADRFRYLWEALGGTGAKAIDYSREHVDGGSIPEPINPMQFAAGKALAQARSRLGERSYNLVSKVCGEGRLLTELFQVRRERHTAADNLRHSLDDLGLLWGIATQAPSRRLKRAS